VRFFRRFQRTFLLIVPLMLLTGCMNTVTIDQVPLDLQSSKPNLQAKIDSIYKPGMTLGYVEKSLETNGIPYQVSKNDMQAKLGAYWNGNYFLIFPMNGVVSLKLAFTDSGILMSTEVWKSDDGKSDGRVTAPAPELAAAHPAGPITYSLMSYAVVDGKLELKSLLYWSPKGSSMFDPLDLRKDAVAILAKTPIPLEGLPVLVMSDGRVCFSGTLLIDSSSFTGHEAVDIIYQVKDKRLVFCQSADPGCIIPPRK
jgi:hypothetical protein